MDLKPTNIIFENEGLQNILLLDFGISKIERENQITEVIGISHCYCPPEIIDNGISKVSAKSDIFSAGMFINLIFFLMHFI